MSNKTYYAKLDCYSATANTEHIAGEQWKNLCDFMTYLSGSDKVTLVTWNSGSSAATGSFENRTFWDGNLPFGRGAHAVWRINTSSTRNWEWYLYAQVVSGSAAVANETFNSPIVNYSTANMENNANTRGIIIQAATCFSGSSSLNPWNGTISGGNSTAGTPRWVSGALDRTMYVLPRSNDSGGIHATNRNNSVSILRGTSITSQRFHMIFDGDAFTFFHATSTNTVTYYSAYVGPFELRNSLTGSGICNSPYGFTMYTAYNADPFMLTTLFGNTAGSTIDPQGGIAVPIGALVSGSKGGISNINQTFGTSTTYQPNYITDKYDEFPVMIGVNESPNFGLLGQFNYGLYRTVLGPNSEDVVSDFSRAIIGSGGGTVGNRMISIPWTGSFAPGVSFARTGSNYTWTKDYG